AARKATRDLEPISVFISRKAQRLYIRQAFQPILDIPVTIEDPDRPIGTHIFTAVERTNTGVRWSVVSLITQRLDGNSINGGRNVAASSADLGSAKAALERLVIPQEALDQIAELVSPRSSIIISDEALSPETGKGTEFVVLLSGEPQG